MGKNRELSSYREEANEEDSLRQKKRARDEKNLLLQKIFRR